MKNFPHEASALVKLYHALSGDKWGRNDKWNTSEINLENWFGITTNENGRVTRIELAKNGLYGKLNILKCVIRQVRYV